jgi:hypothetical protein
MERSRLVPWVEDRNDFVEGRPAGHKAVSATIGQTERA